MLFTGANLWNTKILNTDHRLFRNGRTHWPTFAFFCIFCPWTTWVVVLFFNLTYCDCVQQCLEVRSAWSRAGLGSGLNRERGSWCELRWQSRYLRTGRRSKSDTWLNYTNKDLSIRAITLRRWKDKHLNVSLRHDLLTRPLIWSASDCEVEMNSGESVLAKAKVCYSSAL